MSMYRTVLGLSALTVAALLVVELNASPTPPAQQVSVPGGVAAFRFISPSDGQVVGPFQEISWRVKTTISSHDNQGLALFSFDLVQEDANPVRFNIPRPEAPMPVLQCFDLPAGFTNPAKGGNTSGFRGTSAGPFEGRDMRQIGGAQNTFGRVGPCHGQTIQICMGQDIDVDTGIGHAPSGVVLARGEFRAPEAPGTYVLRIENVIANTIDVLGVAPNPTSTLPAAIRCLNDTITFTVQ